METHTNGEGTNRRSGVGMQTPDGFGARLRDVRLVRALSQVELAEKAGISSDVITKAECGHRRPQPRTIRKLADALEVDVEYLTSSPRR